MIIILSTSPIRDNSIIVLYIVKSIALIKDSAEDIAPCLGRLYVMGNLIS